MRRAVGIKLLILGIILLTGVAAFWQKNALLAWYYANRVSAVSEDRREHYAGKVELLGLPGSRALVNLFTSTDQHSCRNAGVVLYQVMMRWGWSDPRVQSTLMYAAESCVQFSTHGRSECLSLLHRLSSDQMDSTSAQMALATKLLAQVGSQPEARLAALELTVELLKRDIASSEALLAQAKAWVVAGLKDEHPSVRLAAVRLAVNPSVRTLELLPPMIHDHSSEVRHLVLLALGENETLLNTDTLCQLLQDSDAEVRGVCERALRVRGLSSAQVSLAKRMHDPQPLVRAELPDLLLGLSESDILLWMERLAKDPSPAVRAAAIRAMGSIGDLRFESMLRQVTEKETDATVREIALFFLMKSR